MINKITVRRRKRRANKNANKTRIKHKKHTQRKTEKNNLIQTIKHYIYILNIKHSIVIIYIIN